MKLCLISDTHEEHRSLEIPVCDTLIHSGDITYTGKLDVIRDFNEWVGQLKDLGVIKNAIMIAGNHDWSFYKQPKPAIKLITNLHYLEDSGVKIDGINFWGSPWTPKYYDWAFMKDGAEISQYWGMIPNDTNVLITHGPPFEILDYVDRGDRAGCPYLAERVKHLKKLKLHVFGHIHESYGQRTVGKTDFVNAATCNASYQPVNKPILYEYR
jgi:Icc-related predicted phosphoesterase